MVEECGGDGVESLCQVLSGGLEIEVTVSRDALCGNGIGLGNDAGGHKSI